MFDFLYIFISNTHTNNGDKMKENINVLDELNKGACMGMDAIHFIIDKVEDRKFKKLLDNEYKEYKNISCKVNEIYKKYDSDKPQKTSAMNKAMTWYGVEIKLALDNTDSKIAELLLQGTNMGIIEGRKILNNKNIDSEIKKLVNEYVEFQEKMVEDLKKHL